MSFQKENQRPPRTSAPAASLRIPARHKHSARQGSDQSRCSTKASDDSSDEMRFPGIPEYYRRSCDKKPPPPRVKTHSRKTMSADLSKSQAGRESPALEEPGEEQTCPITLRAIVPTVHPNLKSVEPSTIFELSPSPKSPFAFLCCWSSQRVR